jgi:hypothetical protein
MVVLIVNLTSAILLIIGFIFEFFREQWIIKTFDLDYSKPEANLITLLPAHPDLQKGLHFYNKWYFWIYSVILVFNLANVGLSARLIYIFYAKLSFLLHSIGRGASQPPLLSVQHPMQQLCAQRTDERAPPPHTPTHPPTHFFPWCVAAIGLP